MRITIKFKLKVKNEKTTNYKPLSFIHSIYPYPKIKIIFFPSQNGFLRKKLAQTNSISYFRPLKAFGK